MNEMNTTKEIATICEIFDNFTIVCQIHYVTLYRDAFSDVCMFSVLWLTQKSRRHHRGTEKSCSISK